MTMKIKTTKTIIALTIFIILIILHLILLLKNFISDGIYAGLFVATGVLAFGIYFSDKLKELDLLKGRLILQKAKKIKDEVRATAISLIKLMALNSSYTSGSWRQRKGFNDQMATTLQGLEVSKTEVGKIMKVPRTIERLMKDGKQKLTKKEQSIVDKLFTSDK